MKVSPDAFNDQFIFELLTKCTVGSVLVKFHQSPLIHISYSEATLVGILESFPTQMSNTRRHALQSVR